MNRKVQLKPRKWKVEISAHGVPRRVATEVLLVLKWGGVLTERGKIQASHIGKTFRTAMYPSNDVLGLGLLRLHSTFRHDLKIYSSDEGRCLMTAAAFAKTFLDLEGELPPILTSLVRLSSSHLLSLSLLSLIYIYIYSSNRYARHLSCSIPFRILHERS